MGYVLAVILFMLGFLMIMPSKLLSLIMHPLQFFSPDMGPHSKFFLYMNVIALINMLVFFIPAWLVLRRWWRTRKAGDDFLPLRFRAARRLGYIVGIILSWLGHIMFFGTFVLFAYALLVGNAMGIPFGIGIGFALWVYMLAVVCVEISIRRWQRA